MESLHRENIFVAFESNGQDLAENTHSKEMKNGKGPSAPQSAVIQPLTEVISEEDAVVIFDHEVMESIGCPSVSDQETGENGIQEMEPASNGAEQSPEMKSSGGIQGVAETEFSSTPETLEIREPETDGVQALDSVRNLRGRTTMARLNTPITQEQEGSSNEHVGRRRNLLLPWQEDAIEKAIEDCDKGMRVSQAARCHNIADSTLRGRLKKISSENAKAATARISRVGRRRGPVQEDAVRKAMKDYNKGSSLVAALNRYDVPVSTLYDRLESGPQKGTLDKNMGRGTPALEDAIRDYDRGCTVRMAAARNGVSDSTLHHWLKKRLDNGAVIRSEQTVDVNNRRTHAEEDSSISAYGKKPRISRSEAVQDVESSVSPQRASKQRGVRERALKVVKKVPWTESAMQKALAEVGRGNSLTSASERHRIPQSTLRDRVYGRSKPLSSKKSLSSTPIRKSLSPVRPSADLWSEDDIQKDIEDVDRPEKRENEQGTMSRPRRLVKPTKRFGKAFSDTVRWHASTQHSKLKKIGSGNGKNTSRQTRNPKWSEKDMLRALKDVKKGLPISQAARINGIPSGTLDSRIKRSERKSRNMQEDKAPDFPLVKDKSVRRPSGQEQLVQYINKLGSFGFIPKNNDELLEAVNDFDASKDLCVSLGKSALDKDWLGEFLAQNDSEMKISRMMNSCQKGNPGSSNPFLVYNFYDALEQISTEKNLQSNQVWTCCEAGFLNSPHKVKGRVRFDVGVEHSTTCLIACGGAGQVLDPFIIYPERVDQAALRGSVILPGTSHAVSDSGCMTAAVFDNWFGSFTNLVKQRPLLLIVDSQLTYLSVRAIQMAASENIFLMKIPCNTSDVLQPLWQFCFAQFASKWKTALTEWLENRDNDEQMSKADFAEQLSSVWHECLSQEDITAGFESTGVFPVNRTQFPANKLDKGLLRLHAVWLAAGKPEHMAPDIPAFFNPTVTTPSLPSARATRSASQPVPLNFDEEYNEEEMSPHGHVQTASGDASTPTPPDSASGVPFPLCWCRSPPAPIPGRKWVPTWTLLDDAEAQSNSFAHDSR